MALLRPLRRFAPTVCARGLATTPVRSHAPMLALAPQRVADQPLAKFPSSMGPGSGALLAGSPLFLTDLNAPFNFSEIQFVLAGPINSLFESFFETEGGPLFLNALVMVTLMKMGTYYGFMQPSYLWHFQERYGQTWTVGHHLYGCSEPNPLKKGN